MPHTSMWSTRFSFITSSSLCPRGSNPSKAEYAAALRPFVTTAWMYFSRTWFWIVGTNAAPGVPTMQCGGHVVKKSGVVGRVLVVVARRDDELVLVSEVADVARDHRRDVQPARDAQAAALDEVHLDVNHEQRVSHAYTGRDGLRDSSGRAHPLWQVRRRLQRRPRHEPWSPRDQGSPR